MPGSSNTVQDTRRHSTSNVQQDLDRQHSGSNHNMDRRHSSSSDTSQPDVLHLRQLSTESVENIPTRTAKVVASKPAANPLQFIKVGPCNLYRSAQQQLKKAEEVKKIKEETRNQEEDWQSNLDNWKSSRRKRQEHIIERVVEVKKMEMEEFDRNRRRSKTFNEMMEERNRTGRKLSLAVYTEDDSNDLSDLGIGTSSGKSSICGDSHDENHSMDERDENDKDFYDNHTSERKKNGYNGNDTCNTASSPEPEEYTYERAIQSYVNYTETRAKGKNINLRNNDINDNQETKDNSNRRLSLPNGTAKKPPPPVPRRDSSSKIEERLAGFEQRRLSNSSTDLHNTNDNSKKINLPKVDISKRRELFEKASESCENINRPNRHSGDFSNTKSVKEKLSHIGKNNTNNSQSKAVNQRMSGDFSSVKERLANFKNSSDSLSEKDTFKFVPGHSTENSPVQTVQERLISLEANGLSKDETFPVHNLSKDISEDTCIEDRDKKDKTNVNVCLENEHTENSKNIQSQHESDCAKNIQLQHESDCVKNDTEIKCSKDQSSKRQIHRSLDSLDIVPHIVKIESFERVQSLEDLEFCNSSKNFLPSASSNEMLATLSQSGDTDREDSGIHTADVSCSVSQADEPVEDGDVSVSDNKGFSGNDMYQLEMEILKQEDQVHCFPHSSSIETAGKIQEDPQKCVHSVDVCEEPTVESSDVAQVEQNYNTLQLADNHSSCNTPLEVTHKVGSSCAMDNLTTDNHISVKLITCDKIYGAERNTENKESKANESKLEIKKEDENFTLSDDVFITDAHNSTNGVSLKDGMNFSPDNTNHDNSDHLLYDTPANINEIPPLSLNSDIGPVDDIMFPLGPPTAVEPPKEKPPPPPCDISDEEQPVKETSLRRLDSTKRIKKEIRKKRSDFLGIEGSNDDCYLEPELKVAPPPDMTTFLVEERRSEKQLYRQSICSESDSNLGETTESRDSGVELDRGHSDDMWSSKQNSTSEGPSVEHSRDNSEIYCNMSVTSEEDEITKREREIIENLEKEEQWRYNNHPSVDQNNIGEKLAEKLRQLEQEKLQLEWERSEEESKRRAEEMARQEEALRLRAKEQELQKQENTGIYPEKKSLQNTDAASGELLRAERERLQKEHEELERKRESLLRYEQQPVQWGSTGSLQHWDPAHSSLQDVSAPVANYQVPMQSPVQSVPLNYRLSLPNLQQDIPPIHSVKRPPPPVPPCKPNRGVSPDIEDGRTVILRTRSPSVDQLPQQNQTSANIRPQQMSRQTLQALSAVPKSRLISNDRWMQPKKKPENQRTNNYQHWLVQEAEHRRITEQQQRNALSPRKTMPPHHQQQQQQQQAWNNSSPPRQDKPLPDSIIQTLTQRIQNRVGLNDKNNTRHSSERSPNRDIMSYTPPPNHPSPNTHPQMHPSPNTIMHSSPNTISHLPIHPSPNTISHPPMHPSPTLTQTPPPTPSPSSQHANSGQTQEKMLSVSGKKKCSHCGEELGRGAAMIIESLRLFFHIDCFKCCVCHVQLGDGLMGTDVRVRNNKLHCHNCYSSDDGVKFSCV